jgi:hypothetical protein
MTISEETLIAFADGELADDARAEVERALAQDEALRARLAAHQRLRQRLSAAFDGALDEPVPARVQQAVKTPRAPAPVVDLAARRAAKWSAREWGAMAASVAAGLVLGVGLMGAPAPMIAAEAGGLVARGALSRALDTQLATDASGAVRIGLSFRANSGAYCRTFDLTDAETAGLACRDGEAWSIALTAANPNQGAVRMAGGAVEILATVDAMIEGEPLDAEAEAAARDQGWR